MKAGTQLSFLFIFFQDPSYFFHDATYFQDESALLSETSLECPPHTHTHPGVCLLGNFKSSQVDDEDEP